MSDILRARGRWIQQLPDGSWIQGPRQVRSDDEPRGFEELARGDAAAVRQGNLYMKKALKGLTNRHMAGGIASLKHPYNSYVWSSKEVDRMFATLAEAVSSGPTCSTTLPASIRRSIGLTARATLI